MAEEPAQSTPQLGRRDFIANAVLGVAAVLGARACWASGFSRSSTRSSRPRKWSSSTSPRERRSPRAGAPSRARPSGTWRSRQRRRDPCVLRRVHAPWLHRQVRPGPGPRLVLPVPQGHLRRRGQGGLRPAAAPPRRVAHLGARRAVFVKMIRAPPGDVVSGPGLGRWLAERVPIPPAMLRAPLKEDCRSTSSTGCGASAARRCSSSGIQVVDRDPAHLLLRPEPHVAYDSVHHITFCARFGWFVRGIHHGASQLMFVAVSCT